METLRVAGAEQHHLVHTHDALDRGSIYRAQLTRDTARMLNMEPCYTAAYSEGLLRLTYGMI